MDWQLDWSQQADFLQRWPELHSLLAAYIALEDMEQGSKQFLQENKPHVVQQAKTQLAELIASNNQTWLLAAKLAGIEITNQSASNNQAWLLELARLLELT